MCVVEELSIKLKEEQTTSEHQGTPVDDKEPPIADSIASWNKPKAGPFLFSEHMSNMGKEDVNLTANPMNATFPKVVDHDETLSGGDVGEGVVVGTLEWGMR